MNITNNIEKCKRYDELYSLPIKNLANTTLKYSLSVLLLNTVCHGFGDIIFVYKLRKLLAKAFPSITFHIATLFYDEIIKFGEHPGNVVRLHSVSTKHQCRRFSRLNTECDYDLYFVAPIISDFDVSFRDVKMLCPKSDRFNTYFFSEYNMNIDRKIMFNTGVGNRRLGLLFTTERIKKYYIPTRYAVSYIAHSIHNAKECFLNFAEMIVHKYKRYTSFSIILPSFIKLSNSDIDLFRPFYARIVISGQERIYAGKGRGTLYLRKDVYPVRHELMMGLIKYSVRDILVTGDQSITDVLACCKGKNIFYQIAPWKEGFARNLTKALPNPYLKKKSTSCGGLKAIKYNSDYKKFVRDNDFIRNARSLLKGIFNMAEMLKRREPDIIRYQAKVLSSRSLKKVKDYYRK